MYVTLLYFTSQIYINACETMEMPSEVTFKHGVYYEHYIFSSAKIWQRKQKTYDSEKILHQHQITILFCKD
jgi:hypothetical protein